MEREADWRNELLTASACCSFACLAAASLAVAGIGLVAASAVAGIGLALVVANTQISDCAGMDGNR